MNFLAHAYLSFGNPDLIVGNIIADMIKGKQIEKLPSDIQQGVILHRKIDTFTDRHPVVKDAMQLFSKSAGRYAGLFIDISFDHFLATSKKYEPQVGWEYFSDHCYSVLEARGESLPPKFISMFMYMKSENWLLNYQHRWMIKKSFERVLTRTSFLEEDALVFQEFEEQYENIGKAFSLFFPDLINFVEDEVGRPL